MESYQQCLGQRLLGLKMEIEIEIENALKIEMKEILHSRLTQSCNLVNRFISFILVVRDVTKILKIFME